MAQILTSMKKLVLILLSLVSVSIYAQKREKRDVSGFNQVTFAFPGTLYLKQGSSFSVELSGDKELLDKIETEVEGSRLAIKRKDLFRGWSNWDNHGSLTAYVTLPKLTGVSVMGSGKIVGHGIFKGQPLDARVSGSGSISLEVDAEETELDVSGSGTISLKGTFAEVESGISGSGKIELNGAVAGGINSTISGSGRLATSGTAKSLKSSISGSGKVAGFNLVVEKCYARISGSGSVEINATKEIDAEISGSGTVLYKGSPDHISSHSSGSGKVKKAE